MMRDEIINALIGKHGYTSYLEIGVYDGKNLAKINCPVKIGVDPDRKTKATVFMTSDEFFAVNQQKFDIIFIDGLHHANQVIRDVENSLAALDEGGTIVMHDCNPTTREMQAVPRQQGEWTGDVWKAFVHFRERDDLKMSVVNTDYGVGIIQRGGQLPLRGVKHPTYDQFKKNKKHWLNLISVNEFTGEKPQISVCIPTFEQYGFGANNLTSLLKSTAKQNGNFEVIVSDNSKDDSIKNVCELFNETSTLNIIYVHNERIGISENTNNAIRNANSDFIKIMYMDDLFLDNNALVEFTKALQSHHWVASAAKAIDQFGVAYKSHMPKWSDTILTGINTIGMPSVLAVRKNEFEFDVNLKTRLDCDYMYMLHKKYGPIHVIPKYLVAQRYWARSTSRVQGNQTVSEWEYLKQKHNL